VTSPYYRIINLLVYRIRPLLVAYDTYIDKILSSGDPVVLLCIRLTLMMQAIFEQPKWLMPSTSELAKHHICSDLQQTRYLLRWLGRWLISHQEALCDIDDWWGVKCHEEREPPFLVGPITPSQIAYSVWLLC
jgi:hypothetical protein